MAGDGRGSSSSRRAPPPTAAPSGRATPGRPSRRRARRRRRQRPARSEGAKIDPTPAEATLLKEVAGAIFKYSPCRRSRTAAAPPRRSDPPVARRRRGDGARRSSCRRRRPPRAVDDDAGRRRRRSGGTSGELSGSGLYGQKDGEPLSNTRVRPRRGGRLAPDEPGGANLPLRRRGKSTPALGEGGRADAAAAEVGEGGKVPSSQRWLTPALVGRPSPDDESNSPSIAAVKAVEGLFRAREGAADPVLVHLDRLQLVDQDDDAQRLARPSRARALRRLGDASHHDRAPDYFDRGCCLLAASSPTRRRCRAS